MLPTKPWDHIDFFLWTLKKLIAFHSFKEIFFCLHAIIENLNQNMKYEMLIILVKANLYFLFIQDSIKSFYYSGANSSILSSPF